MNGMYSKNRLEFPLYPFLASGFTLGQAEPSPVWWILIRDTYRPSNLQYLYDAARLVDTLDNIHFFIWSVTARDMKTDLDLDVNTAFACLAGTSKHVMTSATIGRHVEAIANICEMIAGGRAAFDERSFLSLNIPDQNKTDTAESFS